MKKDGVPVAMPPNPAPSIVTRLIDLGFTEAAGMGAAPISWTTLDAWQRITGAHLSPWEARLLRQLSSEYLAESGKAKSENRPAPWRSEVSQREQELEVSQLQAALG